MTTRILIILFAISMVVIITPGAFGNTSNEENHVLVFNSKNGTSLTILKINQEVDIIFRYDFRNDKSFDGYVYYNIVEPNRRVSQSQNFTADDIPKTFRFSYTPQETGIFPFTKGSMSHAGVWGGEQSHSFVVVERFSKAMKFNGQCEKSFPEFTLVIKYDFSTAACVKPETKRKLIERGWAHDTNHTLIKDNCRGVDELKMDVFHCPLITVPTKRTILNVTGFEICNKNHEDYYILSLGSQGSITYQIYRGFDLNDPPVADAQVEMIKDSSSFLSEKENIRRSFFPSGIEVSYEPQSVILGFNQSAIITATVTIDESAKEDTFWLGMSPYTCFGGWHQKFAIVE